jgi:hypothetical protein
MPVEYNYTLVTILAYKDMPSKWLFRSGFPIDML